MSIFLDILIISLKTIGYFFIILGLVVLIVDLLPLLSEFLLISKETQMKTKLIILNIVKKGAYILIIPAGIIGAIIFLCGLVSVLPMFLGIMVWNWADSKIDEMVISVCKAPACEYPSEQK